MLPRAAAARCRRQSGASDRCDWAWCTARQAPGQGHPISHSSRGHAIQRLASRMGKAALRLQPTEHALHRRRAAAGRGLNAARADQRSIRRFINVRADPPILEHCSSPRLAAKEGQAQWMDPELPPSLGSNRSGPLDLRADGKAASSAAGPPGLAAGRALHCRQGLARVVLVRVQAGRR